MFSKSVFALAAFVTITITPIAHALQNDFPQITSKSELINEGYECVGDDVSALCTMPGGPTYTCNGDDCTEMDRRSPRPKISVVPSAGLAVSNPTTISNPRGTVLVPIRALVK